MRIETDVQRVIVVVLDGLRPDAIERFGLNHIRRLMATGAHSCAATTVNPSVTAAAMTSLVSGVHPARHGIQSDRLFIPRTATGLTPIPEVLARNGLPSSAFMADVAPIFRGFATRVGRRLGFNVLKTAGKTSPEILHAARATLRIQQHGLILFHWPDADHAGHDHGWMSDAYAEGCARMDDTLGMLSVIANVAHDPGTILIALADHGGGGVNAKDHESDHPLDRTIPLLIAGRDVVPTELATPHLVDVPPSILWALGLEVPASYEGRVLHEAFATFDTAASAVA
ncbi:MAG TPA: alkaline phosphatase family protein [Gemmatimonadaceae bacterium]|nr:alkaline phosphatase family protein [Gemmatimonadaceae bacterium]